MTNIILPGLDGCGERYRLQGTPMTLPKAETFSRIVLSAAHVVADPYADYDPASACAIDWDATLAYRHYLAGMGLGIAEAMDTAQRGMGLPWRDALTLIRRTRETLGDNTVPIYNGCGTDHLDPADVRTLDQVVAAYLEQIEAIQSVGGRLILMASRAMARVARGPEDYLRVYERLLDAAEQPVILHWLGAMFDPELSGYWGSDDLNQARDTVLQIIRAHADKVDGIKISLLDAQREIDMRRLLPASVKMYTGDDFNYPELIAGDAHGYSHALLGIFDAIAPAASVALAELAKGNRERFLQILEPTVPLSRWIFAAPTRFYKTGIIFLAYLNGHQDHMVMLGGHQAMRTLPYFVGAFKLADQAGLLRDPDMAVERMSAFMRIYGVKP